MLKFKPGDLVRIKNDVKVDGKKMRGSIGLVIGLETEFLPKDLHESLNREIPYIIVINEMQTYVWEEEVELLEDF